MGVFFCLFDGVFGILQSGYWKFGIVLRKKYEDDVSLKFVIIDICFISLVFFLFGSMD